MRGSLYNAEGAASRARHHALHTLELTGRHEALRDIQLFHIHTVVRFRVGHCRFEELFHAFTSDFVGRFQNGRGFRDILVANQVEHDLDLSGGHAQLLQMRFCHL